MDVAAPRKHGAADRRALHPEKLQILTGLPGHGTKKMKRNSIIISAILVKWTRSCGNEKRFNRYENTSLACPLNASKCYWSGADWVSFSMKISFLFLALSKRVENFKTSVYSEPSRTNLPNTILLGRKT